MGKSPRGPARQWVNFNELKKLIISCCLITHWRSYRNLAIASTNLRTFRRRLGKFPPFFCPFSPFFSLFLPSSPLFSPCREESAPAFALIPYCSTILLHNFCRHTHTPIHLDGYPQSYLHCRACEDVLIRMFSVGSVFNPHVAFARGRHYLWFIVASITQAPRGGTTSEPQLVVLFSQCKGPHTKQI